MSFKTCNQIIKTHQNKFLAKKEKKLKNIEENITSFLSWFNKNFNCFVHIIM